METADKMLATKQDNMYFTIVENIVGGQWTDIISLDSAIEHSRHSPYKECPLSNFVYSAPTPHPD